MRMRGVDKIYPLSHKTVVKTNKTQYTRISEKRTMKELIYE